MAKQPRNPRAQTPVTRHPLFPAIVALWFGALFGLGSLAIRPGLIESAVLWTGIDTIVPAAAPPLGVTARILIALTLAALGGILGATIARRLAAPRPDKIDASGALERLKVRTRDSHPDAPARRPLSVPDEISATPLEDASAAAGAYPGRRRALAIAEEAPQFRAHEYAPLPGGSPQAWPSATEDPVGEPAPLELGAYAAPEHQTFAPAGQQSELPAMPEPASFVPEAPRQTFQPLPEPGSPLPFAAPIAEPAPASMFAEPAAPPIDFARLGAAEPPPFAPPPAAEPASAPAEPMPALDALDLTALTERFAASLRRRREQAGEPQGSAEPAAAPPPPLPAFTAEPAPVVCETRAEPGPPVAAPTPLAMPAAFRPIAFDEADEDETGELESLLPPRQFAMPAAAVSAVAPEPEFAPEPEPDLAPHADVVDDAEAEPEGEPEVEGGYSSLLELSRAPAQRQSFVRIEEPDADQAAIEPVVIFPGQAARSAPPAPVPLAMPQPFAAPQPEAPAEFSAGAMRRFDAPANALAGQAVSAIGAAPQVDREETERALRAALATLQRMSGAA